MSKDAFFVAVVLILATVSGCATVIKCVQTNTHACGFN